MFGGFYSNNIENYQNLNSLDDTDVDSEVDIEDEDDNIQEEIEGYQNNNIPVEEEVTDESSFDNEVLEEFSNEKKVVEGFSEGKKIVYGKHKLFLKSILFGILFYLLSNENVYKLTKPMIKNMNPVIVHSLIFVGLHYLLNIIFD